MLFWPALRCAAQQTEPEVKVTAQEKEYLIATPIYKARIGADGNVHSLRVKGIEFLDDRITGSAGASFFVEHPIALPTLTVEGRTITATNGVYTVKYTFEEGFFTLTLRQSSPKGAAYIFICAATAAYVENLGVTGVAATPVDYDWPDVKIAVPTGEYLELHGGSRVWGRNLGRQVWERSDIAPNTDYTLTVIPGQRGPYTPTLNQLTAMTVRFSHADQLVPAGEPAEFEVRFDNNSNQTISSEMAIRAESSEGRLLMEDRKLFSCKPHESTTLSWKLAPQHPDFYSVSCQATLGGAMAKQSTTFGYDVGAIAPVTQQPADFATYWQEVTTEATAEEVKLTRLEDPVYSTNSVTVYRIGMTAAGHTCFGWLSVPKYPGRYPGLLMLPGDRVRYIGPNAALAECGFVVMTIEPTGQAVSGALKPLIVLASTDLNNPKVFGLRAMVVRYLRAVGALASVSEVDANRLAVTGVGLGGGMAMLLGALDERIQAVAPDVPNFCYVEMGMASPTWPYREVAAYLRGHPDQQQAVVQTLRYFDVANFVEKITCPVLISAGINDPFSKPANIFGVYNRLPGPRSLKLYIAGHEGGSILHWEEKIRWFGQVLGKPTPPPAAPDARAGTP
ncbi:MAG: acetylxylan esterase [Armatimonadota bacterium]